jgi:hypothetical protein
MARYPHNDAGRRRMLFIVLSLSLCVIASLEAQEKTQHPDDMACPVTANLSPEQISGAGFVKYAFSGDAVPRRVSIALIQPEGKEVVVRFIWRDISGGWGEPSGYFVVKGDGKPYCFSLGYDKTGIPVNVPCKEFILYFSEGIRIKAIDFSSLPSEKPIVLCPMPKLEQDITNAYADCQLNPEDKEKALVLIQLLERITPKYDCRRSYDYEPVPAWWLASNGTSDNWIMWLHRRVLEKNADAFRVYVKFVATSDGYIAETMADQMSGILHALPLFVLEKWIDIESDKEQVLGLVRWMNSPENLVQMIEIYRDIAIKEPKYKFACNEIISILGKKSQAEY